MEYPFGAYVSPKLGPGRIIVRTVTGFPYLYSIRNPETDKEIARYRLKDLESAFEKFGFIPVDRDPQEKESQNP